MAILPRHGPPVLPLHLQPLAPRPVLVDVLLTRAVALWTLLSGLAFHAKPRG